MTTNKYSASMRSIFYLIEKEINIEWKQRYAFSGLLLYVCSTVFICYLSFREIVDIPVWNALFWIIQLFAAVNAIAKSFLQETRGRMLYYYIIADPRDVILSKIIYNFLLMLVLSVFNFMFYIMLIGNPVANLTLFFFTLVLGSMGLSSVLTMISSIASKAGNSAALMPILSFPVLLPLLMTTIRLSKNAIDGIEWAANQQLVIILLSLNLIIAALGYILFPYLWKE